MKGKFLKLLTLLCCLIGMSACNEEDFGYNAKDIAYEKAFKELFPNVDPNHTWCTTTSHELKVTTDQPSDIWVFTADGDELIAHYTDVMGSDCIVYDADVQDRYVIVSDGSMSFRVAPDAEVNFAVQTRTGYGPEDNLDNVIDWNAGPCPYYFFYEDLGADADFDFNDIVLKVEYTPSNQQSEAKVTLMAAGGTLPVKVSYVPSGNLDVEESKVLFAEAHTAFGVETDVPVNVKAPKNGADDKTCAPVTLTVPAYYSVARHLQSFVVEVDGRTISATPHSLTTGDQIPRVIVFRNHDNENNAGWTYSWADENQPITDVYPEFYAWVANQKNTGWPNYMSDGEGSAAVVYDTPYFYVKVDKMKMTSGFTKVQIDKQGNQIGEPEYVPSADYIIAEIIPNRSYLETGQGITAYLSAVPMDEAPTQEYTTLGALSEMNASEGIYKISPNIKNLDGVFYLNVVLDATDYTRRVHGSIPITIEKGSTEYEVIIKDGDIEIGPNYSLLLQRTNQSGDVETNVKTDPKYPNNIKYELFYFDQYRFDVQGLTPADYADYVVEITIPGGGVQFQAYSYVRDSSTNTWRINQTINPPSSTFTVPLDKFIQYVVRNEGNNSQRLLGVRANNGNSSTVDYYYFQIRKK